MDWRVNIKWIASVNRCVKHDFSRSNFKPLLKNFQWTYTKCSFKSFPFIVIFGYQWDEQRIHCRSLLSNKTSIFPFVISVYFDESLSLITYEVNICQRVAFDYHLYTKKLRLNDIWDPFVCIRTPFCFLTPFQNGNIHLPSNFVMVHLFKTSSPHSL